MPLTTPAVGCTDEYCDQLQILVSMKMQALKVQYGPGPHEWNEAVRKINLLVDNLLAENHALRDVENDFQEIKDALDGKLNAVRDQALDLLRWYGVKNDSGGVDPLVLYLKGPLEKARREVEKYATSLNEAEEALWQAISGLHAEFKPTPADASAPTNVPSDTMPASEKTAADAMDDAPAQVCAGVQQDADQAHATVQMLASGDGQVLLTGLESLLDHAPA